MHFGGEATLRAQRHLDGRLVEFFLLLDENLASAQSAVTLPLIGQSEFMKFLLKKEKKLLR